MNSSDTPRKASFATAASSWCGGISNKDLARTLAFYGADTSAYAARQEWRLLLRDITDQHRLEHFGRKIYSQSDEDGIIQEILRRLDLNPRSGRFVEFGVGNGWESNTHLLLLRGFSGLWIERSPSQVRDIRNRFRMPLESGQLKLDQSFVTAENIDDLLLSNLGDDRDVVLLSIDIDGNDFWVWKAIKSIAPSVVVIEYNGNFPPPISIVQEYRSDFVYDGTVYCGGATLEALARLATQKGYQLVGCTITGLNAFFVREDLIGGHFPYALTPANLYEPFRFHMILRCFGSTFLNSGSVSEFGGYVKID